MDDPALPAAEHARALAGLARLNRAARAERLAWPSVRRVAAGCARESRAVRVLDVACGAGDAVARLAARAQRDGLAAEWSACDISGFALSQAAHAAQAVGVVLRTQRADVLAGDVPAGHDLVTCSLFLHHLDRADAVRALRAMRAAAASGVVVDLDRTRAGLALAWVASRALSRSPVVHFDALASVRAAWTPGDALAMAREAGIADARIRRAWPERWVLTWGDA
jgi:2-polyprenyl-3-methyl-5-hydroxy-6-metoxy-1,4-benzoquinol methylase